MSAWAELRDRLAAAGERGLGTERWRKAGRAASVVKEFCLRHDNVLFFGGGFVFDAATLDRIDAWLDLAMQAAYLAGLTALLLLQQREARGLWRPTGRFARAWKLNLEALHFLYGGLLSAYVIFYTKSGISARSFLFFAVVVFLLVYNELPSARRIGVRLRTALFAFCLCSFMVYLVPVLLGRMGDGVFALSMGLSALMTAALAAALAWRAADRRAEFRDLALPAGAVLAAVCVIYALRWIPPVPLSLKYIGIYHRVERSGKDYRLTYEKGPWYALFRDQDDPFYAAEHDRIHCFVRIFAPTRFRHEVTLHWLSRDPEDGRWASRDRIPLPIRGGRYQGWRGFAYKAHWEPGRWRVRVETEDGRVIGEKDFRVLPYEGEGERRWKEVRS